MKRKAKRKWYSVANPITFLIVGIILFGVLKIEASILAAIAGCILALFISVYVIGQNLVDLSGRTVE